MSNSVVLVKHLKSLILEFGLHQLATLDEISISRIKQPYQDSFIEFRLLQSICNSSINQIP